ncbi:MAG: ribokinase [Clostridia bacterium]|nr:ribokinase [Clostridia bacterium]
MRALVFGSMNLDYVYEVEHFVRPGETLAARSRSVKPGGKGLNQSVALARAGAKTSHAGCVGLGGEQLSALLKENGVDTSDVAPVPEIQGHTVIQVNRDGENSILLFSGSNTCVTEEQVDRTLSRFGRGDWLLLQNEINLLPLITEKAAARGMTVALNPSPYDSRLDQVDFGLLSWLLVNEIEAEQITGSDDPDTVWERLHARYPRLSLLLTLGGRGSIVWCTDGVRTEKVTQAAFRVPVVDTTAAGDTFTGYFIAGLMEGLPLKDCMARASRAAAISVSRPGAADSIPRRAELDGQ